MGRQKIIQSDINSNSDKACVPYSTQKEIRIPIGSDEDQIIIILYQNKITDKHGYKYKTVAFTVVYAILYKEKWVNVRKHCWMVHSKGFHTHIRIGKGKKKKKTIHQAKINSLSKALNWSKNDILNNWYKYKNKLIKVLDKS